jgi:excisionase family DNA binding protein
MTPRELAAVLRVSPDKVLGWIHSGELRALNTSSAHCRRPRYVILPHHLDEFERRRITGPPPARPRRQKRAQLIDYYP